jgi:hypothetical protein
MAAIIGICLALAVGLFAAVVRLDRDRAFYPTVTIVVATYYVLFAILGGSRDALFMELGGAALFVIAAVIGFRGSLWITAAALAGHGLFDFVHARAIADPGVPHWWPAFCGAYDVVAGAFLAWRLRSGAIPATPPRG